MAGEVKGLYKGMQLGRGAHSPNPNVMLIYAQLKPPLPYRTALIRSAVFSETRSFGFRCSQVINKALFARLEPSDTFLQTVGPDIVPRFTDWLHDVD